MGRCYSILDALKEGVRQLLSGKSHLLLAPLVLGLGGTLQKLNVVVVLHFPVIWVVKYRGSILRTHYKWQR